MNTTEENGMADKEKRQQARHSQSPQRSPANAKREVHYEPALFHCDASLSKPEDFFIGELKIVQQKWEALKLHCVKEPKISRPDWFAFKADAAIKIAATFVESPRPPRVVFDELALLYKEVRSASFQIQSVASSAYETILNELGEELKILCAIVDAADNEEASLFGALKVAVASQRMESFFCEAEKRITAWKGYFRDGARARVNEGVTQMKTLSYEVRQAAAPLVAAGCDTAKIRSSCETLSIKLSTLHTTYTDLLCELDHLQCAPELEPPFLLEVKTILEQTGSLMATAVWALKSITVQEETWMQQLEQDWRMLDQAAKKLREAISRWGQSRLCPPPEACQAATKTLLDYTEQGLKRVRMLSLDSPSSDALEDLSKLTGQVYREFTTLSVQTAQLQEFHTEVFEQSWWRIVRICRVLDEHRKEKKPEASLEAQFAGLLQQLAKAEGKPAMAQNGIVFPWMTPYQEPFTTSDGECLRRLPEIRDVWAQSEKLINELKNKASERLRQSLDYYLSLSQTEQSWLGEYAATNKASAEDVRQRTNHQWEHFYVGVTAFIAVAQGDATAEEKQQFAAVEEQMAGHHRKMDSVLGVKGVGGV